MSRAETFDAVSDPTMGQLWHQTVPVNTALQRLPETDANSEFHNCDLHPVEQSFPKPINEFPVILLHTES